MSDLKGSVSFTEDSVAAEKLDGRFNGSAFSVKTKVSHFARPEVLCQGSIDQVDAEKLMALMAAPAGGGPAQTFASQTYPYSVATDGKSVYFTSGLGGGALYRQPIAGGAPAALATNQYYPNAVVTDGTSVYWSTGQGGAGTVSKVSVSGGTPVALATSQAYPTSLALNSTRLFWVDFGDGTIRSVPK